MYLPLFNVQQYPNVVAVLGLYSDIATATLSIHDVEGHILSSFMCSIPHYSVLTTHTTPFLFKSFLPLNLPFLSPSILHISLHALKLLCHTALLPS